MLGTQKNAYKYGTTETHNNVLILDTEKKRMYIKVWTTETQKNVLILNTQKNV